MPLYECVAIARQDISSSQVESLIESFGTILTEGNGSIVNQEYWGLKNLAYKINKNRKGHYVMMHIDAPADAVKEMERNMRLNEDMLRYLTLRVDEFDEGPSVQMRTKNTRDRRDDRRGPRDGNRDGNREGGRDGNREERNATAKEGADS